MICTKTYLLSLVIRSINDFSQAFIFTVLMPVMTSLMILILSSVRAAVLLLRGQMGDMSLSDHTPTFCSSSTRGHREGPGIHDSLQLFCADITDRSFSKCKWRKRLLESQPFSLIQGVTWRTQQYWLRKTQSSQVQSLRPTRPKLGREGKRH